MSRHTHALECDILGGSILGCPICSRRIIGLMRRAVYFDRPDAVRQMLVSIRFDNTLTDECLTVGLRAALFYENRPAVNFFIDRIKVITPEHLNIFIAIGDDELYDKCVNRDTPSPLMKMVITALDWFARLGD
jgi:hypothetical protein